MCQLLLCQGEHLCILLKTEAKLLYLFALKHPFKWHSLSSLLSSFLFSFFMSQNEGFLEKFLPFPDASQLIQAEGHQPHLWMPHPSSAQDKIKMKSFAQIWVWAFIAVKGWLYICRQLWMNSDGCHPLNSIASWGFCLFVCFWLWYTNKKSSNYVLSVLYSLFR